MKYGTKTIRKEYLHLMKTGDLYCILCGLLIKRQKDLSVEHIVPRAVGGATSFNNCAPAHKWYNHAKADHSLDDWDTRGHIYLKRLIDAWNEHGVKYDQRAIESLKWLQKTQKIH